MQACVADVEDTPKASQDDLKLVRCLEGLTEEEYIMLVKKFETYDPGQQREQIEEVEDSRKEKVGWFDPFRCGVVSTCINDGWTFDEADEAKTGYITRGKTIGALAKDGGVSADTGVAVEVGGNESVSWEELQTYLTALTNENILDRRESAL